ncbi:MAG: hypothetical protein FWB73_07250 [Treponema sp.]|nr:hypothetical protein [Treponema sp.]
MTKRGYSIRAITVIVMLIIGAFVVMPAAAQAYPSGVEFYPAVYGAFSELYPRAKYLEIDFYNNSFTFTGITGYSLLTPTSYDLKVQLKNGKIELTPDKIYQKDLETGRWVRVRAFGLYSFKRASKVITDKMIEIARSESLMERHQRAAMADIFFVQTIMKNFTELAFQDFIDNYAKGSVFTMTGKISDATEYNRPINGVTYRYRIQLSLNTDDPGDVYLEGFFPNVWCFLYTNDPSVIRLSKNIDYTARGTLSSASKSGSSVVLSLVESN